MIATRARPGSLLLLAIPLLLTLWVYYPITRIFFFADDFVHLVEIQNEDFLVFLLRPFGGNAFLLRNLVFFVTYRVFGLDPIAFQWTVLVTHLVNVGLLFAVLRTMTSSAWLACLGATLWGASPLALGSLGWYAAFGHVLVGTTLLLVLLGATRVAAAGGPIPPRAATCWYVLLLLGSTCYGPGIGVALVSPVVLGLLLPQGWNQPRIRWAYLVLPLATLGLYFGLRWLYGFVGTLPMTERLHERVALSSFDQAPILIGHFLVYSAAATILAFFMPRAYPSPAAWATFGALAAGIGLTLWRGSWPVRRATLAMLALWLGVYGMIAAGRANLMAILTIPPTSGAVVPRYHYAGPIPIVALLCLALRELGGLPVLRRVPAGPAFAVGLALLITGYRMNETRFPIDMRRYSRNMYLGWVGDVSAALASTPPGETLYVENESAKFPLLGPMLPPLLIPGRATVVLLDDPSIRLDGRDVRFIERNPDILAWYRAPERAHTPLARLLVAPDEVPGGR